MNRQRGASLLKTVTLASFAMFFSLNALAANKPARRPASVPSPQQAAQASPAPVLVTMGQELDREMRILSKASPSAYFLNYTLTSTQRAEVMGSNGALLSSAESRSRWLETQVRVGSYDLDNTHKVGNSVSREGSFGTSVPVEDDAGVLRRAMWLLTEKQYTAAAEGLIKINTSKEVQAQTAEEHAPDFSREQPHVFYGPEVSVHPDRKPWEDKVRLYTHAFRTSPQILNSIVTFSALGQNQYQANSEGSRLQFGQIHYRLELFIQGKAPDGMDINRYFNFDWTNPADAPDDKTVLAEGQVLRKELEALVAAPLVEPYAGPALLTGRACHSGGQRNFAQFRNVAPAADRISAFERPRETPDWRTAGLAPGKFDRSEQPHREQRRAAQETGRGNQTPGKTIWAADR